MMRENFHVTLVVEFKAMKLYKFTHLQMIMKSYFLNSFRAKQETCLDSAWLV